MLLHLWWSILLLFVRFLFMSLHCRKVLPKFDNKSVAGVRNRLFAGAPNIKYRSKVKMQKKILQAKNMSYLTRTVSFDLYSTFSLTDWVRCLQIFPTLIHFRLSCITVPSEPIFIQIFISFVVVNFFISPQLRGSFFSPKIKIVLIFSNWL